MGSRCVVRISRILFSKRAKIASMVGATVWFSGTSVSGTVLEVSVVLLGGHLGPGCDVVKPPEAKRGRFGK